MQVFVHFTLNPNLTYDPEWDYEDKPKSWKWVGQGTEITNDETLPESDVQFSGPIGTEHEMINYLNKLFTTLQNYDMFHSYRIRNYDY